MTSLRQRNTVSEKDNEPTANIVKPKAQTGKTWGRDRGKYLLYFSFAFFLKKIFFF
jgi:hypothetical protein